MAQLRHGKYLGSDEALIFCKALVRPDPRSRRHVLVQFDRAQNDAGQRTYIGQPMCHGWHRFKRSDFKIPLSRSQCAERKAEREFIERVGL